MISCCQINIIIIRHSHSRPSQILQLTKSVGGTNAPRADNFSSATNLSFRWEQSCCTGFVPTAGLDLREGWTDNFVAEKWQICGGAKSALAFFWIDLHRFWQNKNWSLHTAQPKKVCKYLAKIQNEGSRSPWRKIIRSGGIRSPNPLRRVGWGTWLDLTRKLLIGIKQWKSRSEGMFIRKTHLVELLLERNGCSESKI